uniref:Uncharacterized protein n=1 Tax=Hyaloperonospora arabidopsidis (strain Emoy2) TaxID=559515 RepID=M4BS24_HYAAE
MRGSGLSEKTQRGLQMCSALFELKCPVVAGSRGWEEELKRRLRLLSQQLLERRGWSLSGASPLGG